MDAPSRLENFPISFFAMVIGLPGFALAWEKAEPMHSLAIPVHLFFTFGAAVAFIVLLSIYAYKLVRHQDTVIAELNHPINLYFVPAVTISLVLIATAILNVSRELSLALWIAGAIFHLTILAVRGGRICLPEN